MLRSALIALVVVLAAPAAAFGYWRSDTTRPTVQLTAPADGSTVKGAVTVEASASDNRAVNHVTFRVDGAAVSSDYSAPYTYDWDTTGASEGDHVLTARAADNAGNVSASPDPSVTVTVDNTTEPPPPPPPDPPPSGDFHYTQQPAHTGMAHDDAYCNANRSSIAEAHPANDPANHTLGDPTAAQWGTEVDASYWTQWGANRDKVTGASTGTTGELIQWAACKWGIEEDLLRAVAVQETDWRQYFVGDNCGTEGEASYSIIQVKNRYCSGSLAWGGYPQTQQSTAFALDFYGAYLRSCVDDAFDDGGSWLYGGQSTDQIAAANGWDYVWRGCVGSWFSGDFEPHSAYADSVYTHLANRDWEAY